MSITRTQFAGTIVALGLIVPASALAATIEGGPRGEHLRGTNSADLIDGNGGNDVILGRGGNDRLIGGLGNDRVFGGAGSDTIFGGNGRDRIAGGTGDDVIDGGAGNDTIFANRGVDTISGGDGNDTLWAQARGDVAPGPGVDQVGDTVNGGNGNDTIHTRDGEVDRITCGPGHDRALLDEVDVIVDATAANPNGSCEIVKRKAPTAADSAPEDAQESPPAASAS